MIDGVGPGTNTPLAHDELVSSQRDFLEILREFVETVSDRPYTFFAEWEEFRVCMRANAEAYAGRLGEVTPSTIAALEHHYTKYGLRTLATISNVGGVKLVLGGSSRYSPSHNRGILRTALYADTILVPDPILPWVEATRTEERFRDVLLLMSAFEILQLKPIVDADLSGPPVLIFPSWEKSLERSDEVTLHGIDSLVTRLVSSRFDIRFSNMSEIGEFVAASPRKFLEFVEAQELVVGPGGTPGQPISAIVASIKEYEGEWRSSEYLHVLNEFTDAQRVFGHLVARMSHQYHLLENSSQAGAQPLIIAEQQAHYYRLAASLFSEELQESSVLSPRTLASVKGLQDPRISWLGAVDADALVHLRQNDENLDFRRRLDEMLTHLSEASLLDMDTVVEEFSRGLNRLLDEHGDAVQDITSRYNRKLVATGSLAASGFLVSLVPTLAPLVGGLATINTLVRLAKDGADEWRERRSLSRSLLGIIAHSRAASGPKEQ